MKFKQFLLSKGVIGAFIVVLFYGLLMVGIYFSGYKAVPDKIDRLPVAIVNQDSNSQALQNQLKDNLPFKHVKTNLSLNDAKKQLNDRKIYLIINIPNKFSDNLANLGHDEQAQLKFYINYANPMTAVSAMETVTNRIGNQVQKNILLQQGKAILSASAAKQLEQTTTAAIKATPEAKAAILEKADATKKTVANDINNTYDQVKNSYTYSIVKMHRVPKGMNHSMAPFFLTLSFYIGSMIAAMLIVTSYKTFAQTIGKWRAYLSTQIAIVLIALIAPLFIVGLSRYINHFDTATYWGLWWNHALELFTALNFNLIFSLMLGQLGIMINMPFMLTQVVSGAGLIPQTILPEFFKGLSYISPCYYAIKGNFNILYGGPNVTTIWLQLGLLGCAAIICQLVVIALQKNHSLAIKRS